MKVTAKASIGIQKPIEEIFEGIVAPEDGGEESQCGWIRDKFGVWWQVIPKQLIVWMTDPKLVPKISEAFYKMKKIDIETLKKATE